MKMQIEIKKHPILSIFAMISIAISLTLFFVNNPTFQLILLMPLIVIAFLWLVVAIEKNGYFGLIMLAFYACLFLVFIIDSKILSKQVEQYANEIIKNYPCAPTVQQLQERNENWSGNSRSTMINKNFRNFLAARQMTYQETGLLRYGFFDDSARTYLFELCGQPHTSTIQFDEE